jgi:hypothetical protein
LCIPLEDGQQGPKHVAAKYKKYKINTLKIVAKDGSSNNLDTLTNLASFMGTSNSMRTLYNTFHLTES